MDPTIEVEGTGLTVGELQEYGYSDTDIQSMFSAGDTPTSGTYDTPIGPSFDGSGSGNTSWLSGLGQILNVAATTYTNVSRALNPPKAGTTLYDPRTGLPYGVDPRTGRPVASPQSGTMNILAWVLIALVAVWILRK